MSSKKITWTLPHEDKSTFTNKTCFCVRQSTICRKPSSCPSDFEFLLSWNILMQSIRPDASATSLLLAKRTLNYSNLAQRHDQFTAIQSLCTIYGIKLCWPNKGDMCLKLKPFSTARSLYSFFFKNGVTWAHITSLIPRCSCFCFYWSQRLLVLSSAKIGWPHQWRKQSSASSHLSNKEQKHFFSSPIAPLCWHVAAIGFM